MRPAPHVAAGLALIAAGAALALLVDRVAGIVAVLIGAGFLIPLRPGRRPGEPTPRRRAVSDEAGARADEAHPGRDGGAVRRQ